MKAFFITGTGTNIGKTFVASTLTKQLRERSEKVKVLKPIITGWKDGDNDTEILLTANAQQITAVNIQNCSPWRFKAPLAADMSMRLERRKVDFAEVVDLCEKPFEGTKIIEGAGGIMSPLNEEKTFVDLIYKLKYPVVLVVGSYLGSISHTLTALKILHDFNVHVVVNETEGSEVSLSKTAESISRFAEVPIIILPHNPQIIPDFASFLN